jgi:hypothetical protein
MGILDWLNFQSRVDAGPQSSGGHTEQHGDVTVRYTEDTSAPYPHYMHEPVTVVGEPATIDSYGQLTGNLDQMTEAQRDEAYTLAARMLDTIE